MGKFVQALFFYCEILPSSVFFSQNDISISSLDFIRASIRLNNAVDIVQQVCSGLTVL